MRQTCANDVRQLSLQGFMCFTLETALGVMRSLFRPCRRAIVRVSSGGFG
jgi:hypothetical protein